VRRLAVSLVLCLAATAAGCTRPAKEKTPDAGPPPVAHLPELLPAPAPWSFARARGDAGIALPERCRYRAPTVRADVPGTSRFVAEPGTLGGLIVADSADSPPRLTGVAALTLDPAGATRDPVRLPWFDAEALPRLSRSDGRWVAAIDGAGAAGTARVTLWRGGEAEVVGEGDGFEATDLACSGSRCALLTSRIARVAVPGAIVWLGAPGEPASRWRPVEIVPALADSDARPVGLAAIEADGRATAALLEKGVVIFVGAGEAGAHETGRIPAPPGVLDAAMVPRPVVLASASKVDDDGCARDGKPGVRLAREGAPPVDFALPAPPQRGVLRRLSRGALAAWITPIGCRSARRVVYALVLDEVGAPVGAPVPIVDATGFAVATKGDDVDVFLQDATSVTWVRATCAAR
jgi:hypothetical protein